jgi:hypothetical protein
MIFSFWLSLRARLTGRAGTTKQSIYLTPIMEDCRATLAMTNDNARIDKRLVLKPNDN